MEIKKLYHKFTHIAEQKSFPLVIMNSIYLGFFAKLHLSIPAILVSNMYLMTQEKKGICNVRQNIKHTNSEQLKMLLHHYYNIKNISLHQSELLV